MKVLSKATGRDPRPFFSNISLIVCAISVIFVSSCSSQGACAQLLPSLEPSQAAPGETFRIHGGDGGFGSACNDSPQANEVGSPERNIRIELQQGDNVWHLNTVDALPDYTLDAWLVVPTVAEPGPATVLIHTEDSVEPLELQFQVLGQETTS